MHGRGDTFDRRRNRKPRALRPLNKQTNSPSPRGLRGLSTGEGHRLDHDVPEIPAPRRPRQRGWVRAKGGEKYS